jgi:hypothetical protein
MGWMEMDEVERLAVVIWGGYSTSSPSLQHKYWHELHKNVRNAFRAAAKAVIKHQAAQLSEVVQ